jgi:aldose sugar dehydrogenase
MNSKWFRRLVPVCAAFVVLALIGVSAPQVPAAAQVPDEEDLPAGVRTETVLDDVHLPVAMAFDPAGRLFYTERDGAVRLFANGNLQEAPVISFEVNIAGERGLLGIALDPNFTDNHYVYVYYTCDSDGGCPGLQNRVVRFVERDGVGSNPTVLFNSSQSAPNHVGGNIHFGPDGKLYITIGDDANSGNSQDLGARQGKIHRINPDGSMPTDNPRFSGSAFPSVYAYGVRNSFDFVFDPVVRGRIFASENGPGCDDEMNRIEAGGNYGWRSSYPCDDDNPNPQFNTIKPLWYTPDGECCVAPTGIEVYTGFQIPEWRNHIFMAAYNNDALYHFTPNADRTTVTSFKIVRGVRASMDLLTGPDGAMWYMDGGGYEQGAIKRLVGPGAPGTPPPTTPLANPSPTTSGGSGSPTIPGSGSRTFPETGKTVSGIFLDYWTSHGGLPQQGYPISELLNEVSDLNGKAYVMQYFERAVFEYHPENQKPYDVLLSQLGTFRYKTKYPSSAPAPRPNNTAGSVLFPETGKRVGGKFLDYWNKNGGLAQQGFPISDEFTEKSDLDGKTYTVQYFERAVFELHPENAGTQYEVLLSQLGTFRYREKYPDR